MPGHHPNRIAEAAGALQRHRAGVGGEPLGIPAVRASRENLEKLATAVRNSPATECLLDLNTMTMTCGALKVSVEMPEAVKESLVTGQWDFLGQLLDGEAAVAKTAEKIPYMQFAQ